MQTYIGLDSSWLDRTFAPQRNGMWCWAASIQMILRYYGVEVSQEMIVRRSFGLDAWGQIPNKAAGFDVMTANLNKWDIDYRGRHYVVSAGLFPGAPTPELIIRELQFSRPLLLSYQSRPRMNHAVVCTGARIDMSNGVNVLRSIVVRDPAPYKKNIDRNGRIEHRALHLAQKTAAYWLVRVRRG